MPKASPCATASAMDGLLPPPPPPFVIVDPLPLASSSSSSLGSTLLIITAVLGFSFVVCLFIRLGLRLRRSSALVAPASVLSRTDPSNSAPEELTNKNNDDDDNSAPIVSHLRLLELSSSLGTYSKSSPDCAVCLHSFLPDEHIRRLPACGHAFHAECVDTWTRNSPSCPLCRAAVAFPPPPPPSATAPPVKMTTSGSSVRGESRNLSLPPLLASPPRRLRLDSTGSSIDNLMEEDVEAAVARIWEQSDYEASISAYRGDEIWAAMGGGGRRRSLMDSMDRRRSSRSPSFRSAASSFRHSTPSTDQEEDSGGEGGQDFFWNWEAEEDLLSAAHRWITGA